MKRIVLINLLLQLSTICYRPVAAQELYGYVYEQNSGKKPVPGTLLKAFLSNQVVSNDKGNYTLRFQNGTPGKSVSLSVEKAAWVLVNQEELAVNLPEDPLKHPHSIVMCREAVWKKRNQMYETLLDDYITKAYTKKLAELTRLHRNLQGAIDSLQMQLTRQRKELSGLAEVMSRVNTDDLTEVERRAYKLFEEGKIDECVRLRDSLESEKNFLQTRQKNKQLDQLEQELNTAQTANEQALDLHRRNIREQARLSILQFDYGAADEKLSFLANEDTTQFSSLYDYVEFLQQQRQPEKAIPYGLQALQQARTDIQRCKVQNTLSILYRSINNYPAAHQVLHDAAAITTAMYDSISVYTASYVAITQNNLGLLYKDENNYPAAAKALHTALLIRKRQAEINQAIFEPCVATAQANLGTLYIDNGDYLAAEEMYKKASAIYQRLANSNPAVYNPLVSTVQNNLGLAYFHQEKYTTADSAYVAAIRISRSLALNNPAAYLPDIAETDVRLGTLYRTIKDFDIADSALQEALRIRTELATRQPAAYQSCIAEVKMNIGLLNWARTDYAAGEQALKEALEIYWSLAKRNPVVYLPLVADLQNNLGGLYTTRKDTTAARYAFDEALKIYRQLAENNSLVYKPVVANTLYKIGIWNSNKADYTNAKQMLEEALHVYEQLAKEKPADYYFNIAIVQTELGGIYQRNKDTTAAIQAYKAAVQLRKIIDQYQPGISNSDVADLQYRLGRLYRSKNPPAAENAYQEAIAVLDTLLQTIPNKYETQFCRCVAALGELYQVYSQPQQMFAYSQLMATANASLPKCTDSSLNNRFAKLSKFFADDCAAIKVLQNQQKRTTDNGEKLQYQQQIVTKRKALVEGGKSVYTTDLAKDILGLSWYLILNNQFPLAEQTARQVLAPPFTNNEEDGGIATRAKEYLAPALLLQGKWNEAEKIYGAYKNLTYTIIGKGTSASFRELFIKDLDELERAGIANKNLGKARAFLSDGLSATF